MGTHIITSQPQGALVSAGLWRWAKLYLHFRPMPGEHGRWEDDYRLDAQNVFHYDDGKERELTDGF